MRWKTCEVATQLSRAYAFGDFIKPEQKNPPLALAIAKAGYEQRCGGTAYWLGRIYEVGDALIPKIDKKELGDDVKEIFMHVYDVAILNHYTPAFERMAELYRLDGPARFHGKKRSFFSPYLRWNISPRDDKMYMMNVQYHKCLSADPANLVCARGLRSIYNDKAENFGYTNYNEKLAAYYADYVTKLEDLLVKAGQVVPATN